MLLRSGKVRNKLYLLTKWYTFQLLWWTTFGLLFTGLIDSRSVKTSHNGGESRGIDGDKKTKGRKQHIITDTLGLILVVVIHAANRHDSKGAVDVISNLKGRFPRLRKIVANGGYRGELIENVKKTFGWVGNCTQV